MKYILTLIISITLFSIGNATPPSFINKTPKDGLWEALEYYNIHHKEIVYAQAVLETGWFKSYICKKYNNLFGLKRGKHYYRYNHWSKSVKAYKEKIQSRYKPSEDYYRFLKRIHYATDPKYTKLLKKIVNENRRRIRVSS